jgi:hypothetical protein
MIGGQVRHRRDHSLSFCSAQENVLRPELRQPAQVSPTARQFGPALTLTALLPARWVPLVERVVASEKNNVWQ